MDVNNFLDYMRKASPERWSLIQKIYNDNLKFFGDISYTIIDNLTEDLMFKIFNRIYNVDSEVSIIEIVLKTGIHQELVFRFFYSYFKAMNRRNCNSSFQEWYIPNPFSKQELSSRILLPKIRIEYNKEEAFERGVKIDMQNPPLLSLMPSFGVSQWTHGDTLITTYKRCRAHIYLSINIRVQKETEMLKALCIGVYDVNERVVAAARIWQWRDNSADFEIPVEFECELESLLSKLNRVYFYWEGAPKNYSYLNRLAYCQDL